MEECKHFREHCLCIYMDNCYYGNGSLMATAVTWLYQLAIGWWFILPFCMLLFIPFIVIGVNHLDRYSTCLYSLLSYCSALKKIIVIWVNNERKSQLWGKMLKRLDTKSEFWGEKLILNLLCLSTVCILCHNFDILSHEHNILSHIYEIKVISMKKQLFIS